MGTIDAMKQWLEVLEYWDIHGGLNQPTEDAIASLRQAIADLESQEPVGFAGIEMWIGNTRIKKLMTQAELHSAIDPWAIVKFNSDSCIDALKEKNS